MTVATWIAIAVVGLAVVLFVAVLLSLRGRLARLQTAAIGLQTRAEQAHALEHQLAELEPQLVRMSERLELIGARFGRR